MHALRPLFTPTRLSLASCALITGLSACGGGGSDGSSGSTPDAAATTSLRTTVVDGPLQNAQVCLDLNRNNACDAGEPSMRTDASGNATLTIPTADANRYPLIAIVGTDAIDSDTGAVPTPFTMAAPADQPGLISPLTTLVHTQLSNTPGQSTADAVAAIQAQLGLATSPLANFTQSSSADSAMAATLARLIVVTAQQQHTATAGALATNGQPLGSGEIATALQQSMLQQLQALVTSVLDNPSLADTSQSIQSKQAAMVTAAQQLAAAAGLSSSNLGSVVAAQTATSAPDSGVGSDGAALRWFSFADASNFFIRAFEWTAAQNTPDSSGKRHVTEYREQVVNGSEVPWVRPQVYWTGSDWFACPTDYEHEVTTLASGETESLYCGALRSRAKQTVRDIAGQSIADVVTQIRSSPLQDGGHGSFAAWGPNPSQVQANATWPAGSTLSLRTVSDLGGAEYYQSNNAGRATIPPANDPDNPNGSVWVPATLTQFISWNAGDFASNKTVADVHGNNARVLVSRRDYTKPDGSAAYKRYMVGLETGGAQRARFYECEGDMSTLAETPPRNSTLKINGISSCKTILESSYTVATQGDAQVLRFAAEPVQLNTSNSQTYRLFVERGGVTYVGFRDKPTVSYQQRLNQVAADALLASLGIQ